MTYLIVLGAYAFIIALLLFVSGRRFGIPALGVTAGALIASLWADTLTPQVAEAGLIIEKPPLLSIVTIVLTLLPGLLLMPRSPKAEGMIQKLVGAVLFGVLATLLTYTAFADGVVLDAASRPIVAAADGYRAIMLTVLLVLAIGEVFLRPHQHHKSKK